MADRLGRYEIVGRIATGGMAEVSLGRLRGPHGFERPVVIKRILPHLVPRADVVELFLDEARLIAGLRHPNLVQIHELRHEDDELYMVMEYLEGESVAGLCRRLAARERFIDYDLAAHIIAEACAGLHAAHEATGRDGRPLGVVHRDVSPQNIIVTYSGAVHVIDFGIATSIDRVARTETGTVRGKTEYLAPEQIRGTPLDRRVDVFALGIVLMELASGHRLYRRPSPAAAMMAILSEPAPRLNELRPDAPPELVAIIARALEKDPEARFATAAEMRRALLSFVRKAADDDPPERLARVMRELFSDRAAEKTELLRAAERGDAVATMPEAEVDVAVELPTAADTAFTALASLPPPRRARRTWIGIAVLAVAAVSAVLVSRMAIHGQPPSQAAPATVAPSTQSEPEIASERATPPAPSASATALPSASAAPATRASKARPAKIRVPASKPASSSRPVPTVW